MALRHALALLNQAFRSQIFGYGLNGLDLRLLQKIRPETRRGHGFFVELGANNGLAQSNTYLLQQRFGWTGLLIEPSQARYLDCVRNRSFANRPSFRCAACVDSSYDQPFVALQYSDLMSVALGLDLSHAESSFHAQRGNRFLPSSEQSHVFAAVARTLTSLLDEVSAPVQFDLLSLDVEGNELCVLRGLDFSRYQPRWILVEVRSGDVTDYLLAQGYRLAEVLSDNGVYRDLLFSAP
jgi:FkbM family methyltransferase